MRVVEQFSTDKSPKEVFDYVVVDYFENHQKFDPKIHEMIWRSKPPVTKGTKGTEVRKMAGKRILLDFEVTEFEPLKLFTFKNTSGPLYLERSYSLEPAGGGTKVVFVFDVTPKSLPTKLLFPLLSKTFRKSVAENIQHLSTILNQDKG